MLILYSTPRLCQQVKLRIKEDMFASVPVTVIVGTKSEISVAEGIESCGYRNTDNAFWIISMQSRGRLSSLPMRVWNIGFLPKIRNRGFVTSHEAVVWGAGLMRVSC